ncbi:hypothetical protein D3C73_1148730 [compost metagenome]
MHEGVPDGQHDGDQVEQEIEAVGAGRGAVAAPDREQVDQARQDGDQQAEGDQPCRRLAPHHFSGVEVEDVEDEAGHEEAERYRVQQAEECCAEAAVGLGDGVDHGRAPYGEGLHGL